MIRQRLPQALLLHGIVLFICFMFLIPAIAEENREAKVSKVFETIRFPVPASEADRNYLGLSGDGTFTIADIKSPIVLIEVLSVYCPHCQKTAPHMNEVYREIENRPGLKGKVKIVGVGMENSPFEVNSFRTKYAVPFPILSDDSGEFCGRLYVRQTPTFIGVRLTKGKAPSEFFFSAGEFTDARKFLDKFEKAVDADQDTARRSAE